MSQYNPLIHRLGKRAPKPHRLMLRDYLHGPLPTVPDVVDWTLKVTTPWGMCLNDQLGDCAVAGPAHQIKAWRANATGEQIDIADADSLAFYSLVGGYDGTPATDNGLCLADVETRWQSDGIGGHKIAGSVGVNPHQPDHVALAHYLFGGLDVGLQMPLSVQDDMDAGQPWDVHLGRRGIPGSWGGHCVEGLILCQSTGMKGVVSWGEVYQVTEAFWLECCDECHAMASLDSLAVSGLNPAGLAMPLLLADMQAVAA